MEVCDQRAWGGGRAGELRAGGQGGEALILEINYSIFMIQSGDVLILERTYALFTIQGGEVPEGGGDVQYCKRWL